MKRLLLCLAAAVCSNLTVAAEKPRLLEKAPALPLALDDRIEFRKAKTFLHDPVIQQPTINPSIEFEKRRVEFGAVSSLERRQRYGHYLTFYWRSKREATLTMRFEYRQEKLGTHVQARELNYTKAKGSHESEFQVIGDDYEDDGRITAWRAILIENGRIVALHQSFNWN